MSHDILEREIVEQLIETLDSPLIGSRKISDDLLRMVVKYKSRVGEDSWMQRQYNKEIKI